MSYQGGVKTPAATRTIDHARSRYLTWLRETRDLSDHTVRAYGCDIDALIRAVGDHTNLDHLDSEMLLRFFEQQRRDGIGPSSLRRRAAGVQSFCAFLERQRLVRNNPWPVEGIAFKRARRLPRALPGSDLATLLAYLLDEADIDPTGPAADQPLAKPFEATTLLGTALILTTGLRVSELVAFRTTDIDTTQHTIQVMGKGRRERLVYLTEDWLTRLVMSYQVTRLHLGPTHDHFLVNTRGAPLTTSRMRARLAKAGREAGLRQHVTPHLLRHSAATQLIESGVDIRFVQRLLGHASLTTTEIYTHVSDHALRNAVLAAGVLHRFIGGDN